MFSQNNPHFFDRIANVFSRGPIVPRDESSYNSFREVVGWSSVDPITGRTDEISKDFARSRNARRVFIPYSQNVRVEQETYKVPVQNTDPEAKKFDPQDFLREEIGYTVDSREKPKGRYKKLYIYYPNEEYTNTPYSNQQIIQPHP